MTCYRIKYAAELEEINIVAEIGKVHERLFIEGIQDIQIGDMITLFIKNESTGDFDEETGFERTVIVADDAAGHAHHHEIVIEKIKIN